MVMLLVRILLLSTPVAPVEHSCSVQEPHLGMLLLKMLLLSTPVACMRSMLILVTDHVDSLAPLLVPLVKEQQKCCYTWNEDRYIRKSAHHPLRRRKSRWSADRSRWREESSVLRVGEAGAALL